MMHIALCMDNLYVPYCATVMASVIENNQAEEITFHLLSCDFSDKNKFCIREWIQPKVGITVRFYDVSPQVFNEFPIGEAYLNIGAYFRLYLAECLKDIDKVLYLDCDLVNVQPLHELWNTDISGYAVAGVRDRINDYVRVYNRLGYPMSEGYINSGVILINLKRWREDAFFQKAWNVACCMPRQLKNHDQDIINLLYHGQILMLNFKYNLLEHYLYTEDKLYISKQYYPEIERAIKQPVIIHYCMPFKPWHVECINPYQGIYLKYKQMTPWPDVTLIKKSHSTWKQMFLDRLKWLMGFAGLYHYVGKQSPLRKDIDTIEEPENILF